MVVDGEVSEMLVAPRTVTVDGVAVRVGFSVNPSRRGDLVANDTDSQINISPRRPSQGKPATTFELRMVTLFDENLDPYTLSAMMSSSGDNVSTLQLQNAFRITVKPETEDAQNVLSQNLKDKLPGLVTNDDDYGATGRPGRSLSRTICCSRSLHEDVRRRHLQLRLQADAEVREPDARRGEDDERLSYHRLTVRCPDSPQSKRQIKVQICERVKVNGKSTPGKVLGETILTFTIEPLTQQEIDDAKRRSWRRSPTEEVLLADAIRGENTDKEPHHRPNLQPVLQGRQGRGRHVQLSDARPGQERRGHLHRRLSRL